MTLEIKRSFYPETLRTMMNVLQIRFGKIAFCETQIIDCVQQIGLANAVAAANANNPFIETEGCMGIIFKLDERYGM
jgi:hypothetical protein